MKCIYCFNVKTAVVNSRTQSKNPQIWRRRQCVSCKKVFTSYERPATDGIWVINSSGLRTKFDPGYIAASIFRACQNLATFNISEHTLPLTHTIELKIITHTAENQGKISTKEIVRIAYDTLRNFDEAASIQYALQEGYIQSIRRRGRPSLK